MDTAPLMPPPNVDQLADRRIAPVAIVEIGGAVIGGLLALLAFAGIAPRVVTASAVIVLGIAMIPHGVAIIARWRDVRTGGDQGLVSGGGLLQLAAGACAIALGIVVLRDGSVGVFGIAVVAISGALLISGPAHSLLGPMLPGTKSLAARAKSALVTMTVALSAFVIAVYALVLQHSAVTMNLALLFASIALALAGLARRDEVSTT